MSVTDGEEHSQIRNNGGCNHSLLTVVIRELSWVELGLFHIGNLKRYSNKILTRCFY